MAIQPPHGSIPNYRPGPILTPRNKALVAALIVGPAITYGTLKYRQSQRVKAEQELEMEGRKKFVEVSRTEERGYKS